MASLYWVISHTMTDNIRNTMSSGERYCARHRKCRRQSRDDPNRRPHGVRPHPGRDRTDRGARGRA
ncbi:hypothetical protein CNECB9_980004 [Cupriavidus necator]|uniref:Uncharacterized protein n=1 Tax=Cupriavidus necator TaxID=106590 RepID=A0A1K0JN70_CUPNE|nr:hypothetical protein CNECB9_980004 [Cupriavidus necator]